MENFRQILKTKNTTNILNFIKDNNLSIDEELHYGVTPLMYSSFYDDENTTKELIKLGADVHKKDKYSLSPLAYAIENNSTKTVKILLDSGVKFDDNERIQNYLNVPDYDNIKAIEIDNDKINIIYHYSYSEKNNESKDKVRPFVYALYNNCIEIVTYILESGWVSKNAKEVDNINNSYYSNFIHIPNYEPMLDLLLEHNVSGQLSKELLKEKCIYDCTILYRGFMLDKFDLIRAYILHEVKDEEKLIKLDFYTKDYSETIKLLNDAGIKTDEPDDEVLKKFKNFTNEIRWREKYCSEEYMDELKHLTGSGDMLRWASYDDYTYSSGRT